MVRLSWDTFQHNPLQSGKPKNSLMYVFSKDLFYLLFSKNLDIYLLQFVHFSLKGLDKQFFGM